MSKVAVTKARKQEISETCAGVGVCLALLGAAVWFVVTVLEIGGAFTVGDVGFKVFAGVLIALFGSAAVLFVGGSIAAAVFVDEGK